MAILINGNGNPAIYPDQDADWFASIFGGQTAITGVGSQFAAEIQDANTIALADGVIITKEGRRIQLDANQSDIFEIPTGAQGTTNYYIIGYCLTTNDDSSQTAETFVQLMENATDTIEEDTFRGGADKVYVSLYRVTQTGFNLETPELLLPKVESITQLNADLSDKVGTESGTVGTYTTQTIDKISYDNTNNQLILKVNGADTPVPFKKGGLIPLSVRVYHPNTNSNYNSLTLKYLDTETMTVKTASRDAYGSQSEYGYGSWSYVIDGITWNISVTFVTQSRTTASASANDTFVGNTHSSSYTWNQNASYPYDVTVSFSY